MGDLRPFAQDSHPYAPAALRCADNRGLLLGVTRLAWAALVEAPRVDGRVLAVAVARLSAHVGLVYLDRAEERAAIFVQELPHLLEHPPGRLVGHTQLAL